MNRERITYFIFSFIALSIGVSWILKEGLTPWLIADGFLCISWFIQGWIVK